MTFNPAFALEVEDGKVSLSQMGMKGISVGGKYFEKAFKDIVSPSSGLLPPVIRWVSSSRRTWCMERPPHVVTIGHHNYKLDDVDPDAKDHIFELALPWTAYLVDLDVTYYPERIFVYALNGPLTSTGDYIGILPLPNFYSSGMLCQPHRSEVNEQPTCVGEGLALAYRLCWSSGFNTDLGSAFVWCREQRSPSLLFNEYEESTKGNIMTLLRTWDKTPLNEILKIEKWAGPSNFERNGIGEDINQVRHSARQYARRGGITQRIVRAIEHAESYDSERRGNWDATSVMILLQQVLSSASLLEATDEP